jgi:SAM-dependent methyltransferase
MSKQSAFRQAYPDTYVELNSFFPDFNYRKCVGDRNIICRMDSGADNKVGHQQRAFSCWWGIETCGPIDPGLDIGSHRGLTPYAIHVDKFYDGVHQHPFYGGVISADVVVDATSLDTVFPPSTFPFIGSNHSLEHMPVAGDAGTVALLKQWVGLLRPGGVLAMVIPDNDFWDVMKSDKDHKHAWGAKDFRTRVLDPLLAQSGLALEEYDTLDNHYSFNVVIRKA